MANLTKNEKYIVDMYVRYFGKAPSKAEIAKYNDFKTPKEILTEIRGDADDSKAGLTTEEFVNNEFQNLFGRDATTKEMNKYSKVVDAGKDLPINAIVKSAKKADKGVYEAKKAIAIMLAEKENTTNYNLDKITKDTYANVYDLKAKKLLVDSVADLKTKIEKMPDNVSGTTFMLTASADTGAAFTGTEKGDVFNAYDFVDLNGGKHATLTGVDTLDGGAGRDTLNVVSDKEIKKSITSTISSIETINLQGAEAVAFDTTTYTGVETLNATKGTSATLEAAATTDVNVSGATGVIKVDGGKNVVVNDATADQNITIGATTGAAGTITVTDTKQGTGVIAVDGGTDVTVTATAADDISTGNTSTTGAINVGQTATATLPTGDIKVTQNLEFDGNDAGAAGNTLNLTGGDIKISGGKTVDVTVNANNVAKVAAAANNIVVGTITVKGGDNTTTVTVTQNDNSETFTSAKVAEVKDTQTITFKALTSGQKVVITDGTNPLTFTASKDLTAEEVAAAFARLVANDRQDNGGKVANGVYEGQFAANWSAKSVSGATVTFEAPQTNNTTLADTGSSVAQTVGTVVNGTIASGGVESTNSVEYGKVVIDNTAKTTGATDTIKTVTVDGYATASTIASNALTDLTLVNSAAAATMTLTSTVASLNVTLDNVVGTVDLDGAGVSTLKTLNLTTTGEASDIILDTQAVETLTIAAAADLDISSGSTDLTAVKTVTITGAGDVNLGNLSTVASFTTLTASAATGDITVEIDGTVTAVTTGSGNDTITATVANATTAISKAIDLGAGDDTLVLFDDTTAVPTAAVKGGAGVDTISMTFASAASNENFKNAISGFERLVISNEFGTSDGVVDTETINLANLGFASYVTTTGTNVNGVAGATATDILTLSQLAANATVVLTANGSITAVLATATGTTDVINVIVDATNTTTAAGTFTVADVETVKITAKGEFLDDGVTGGSTANDGIDDTIADIASLTLSADKAKTVTVDGYADLTLDTNSGAASSVLTKVDASKMTGDLVYTANGAIAGTEVIAGSGNDILTADGEKDVLKGGAGNDTFYATYLTKVYGGEGADKFYFATPTQLSKVSTIADLGSGDTIYLVDNAGSGDATDDIVNKFYSAGAEYNANTTTTFEAKVNASLGQTGAGEATWFQHSGNTYIVIDNKAGGDAAAGAVDTYTTGGDVVIEITGLVDLSKASFNATTGSLEIA